MVKTTAHALASLVGELFYVEILSCVLLYVEILLINGEKTFYDVIMNNCQFSSDFIEIIL